MSTELIKKIDAIGTKVSKLETDIAHFKSGQETRDTQFNEIKLDLRDVKGSVGKLETAMATRDVQYDYINANLKDLKGGIGKVLWVLGLAVVATFAKFIMEGGLTVGGG
ncbi:MAG: hypothetical protein U5K75_02420 [Ahrensia sp.]|nr:hypothetical protein [Ahrensia sp.]